MVVKDGSLVGSQWRGEDGRRRRRIGRNGKEWEGMEEVMRRT